MSSFVLHPFHTYRGVQLHKVRILLVFIKISKVFSCNTLAYMMIIYMVFWLPCLGRKHSASASSNLHLPCLASTWFSAASTRPRQFCLGFVKTASTTSLSNGWRSVTRLYWLFLRRSSGSTWNTPQITCEDGSAVLSSGVKHCNPYVNIVSSS